MSTKISLCMIVGNVEEYIRRCLSSFRPIADEICVVRAIGGLKPDKTLDIAREEFGAVTGEYRNGPGHEDWPHLDNFAAARQMSFDLATGDWCFWCDSDDVLESGAEAVRELAERGGYAAFMFPYRILGKGLCLPRERMIASKTGVWKHAVHECFDFLVRPAMGHQDDRVVVVHMPMHSKTGSNERNLRILESIPEADMTTGLRYHLHLEMALAGRIPESVEAAKKVLAAPDLGRAEKYEIFLNMAQVSEDGQVKDALLTQAYMADPGRREALGLLCNSAMNFGRAADALSYARQMLATPMPARVEWNDREAVYGWVGDDLYAQALRMNGMMDEAEKVRRAALLKAGGPRIALIHATRGRYAKAAQARKLWLDQADDPARVEHIFVIDEDDRDSDPLRRMHHLVVPAGGGCVSAWNHGCFASAAPVVVQMSDDWVPPAKWDRLITERIGDPTKGSVLAVSDGLRQDNLLCMAIMTRGYFLADHFMFHPWFKGVYSDNWFTELAYARGAVIEARDLVFEHQHFLKTGEKPDATYAVQNSPERYEDGAKVLEEVRKCRDWSVVPGWFNYWPFYQLIAKRVNDGDRLCEVGVWMGRSLIFLAQELKRLGKTKCRLIAVDTFAGEDNQPEHEPIVAAHGGSLRKTFEANLERCGVADMIEIVQGDSAASAAAVGDGELAFCYIDAAHDYESVCRDLKAWKGKVKKGGILAGHDAIHPPVIKAVKELIEEPMFIGVVWAKTI